MRQHSAALPRGGCSRGAHRWSGESRARVRSRARERVEGPKVFLFESRRPVPWTTQCAQGGGKGGSQREVDRFAAADAVLAAQGGLWKEARIGARTERARVWVAPVRNLVECSESEHVTDKTFFFFGGGEEERKSAATQKARVMRARCSLSLSSPHQKRALFLRQEGGRFHTSGSFTPHVDSTKFSVSTAHTVASRARARFESARLLRVRKRCCRSRAAALSLSAAASPFARLARDLRPLTTFGRKHSQVGFDESSESWWLWGEGEEETRARAHEPPGTVRAQLFGKGHDSPPLAPPSRPALLSPQAMRTRRTVLQVRDSVRSMRARVPMLEIFPFSPVRCRPFAATRCWCSMTTWPRRSSPPWHAS